MDTDEALKLLQRYQDWRTGKDERTMDEAGIVPSEITEALDVLIGVAKRYERLIAMDIKE